jgi:hypothetical protein
MGAIACIVVGIGAGHMEDAGTTLRGVTVGGSSRGVELSSAGGSSEMIGDGCTDANCKVLVESVSKDLLPSAQPRRLRRLSPSVAAPSAGDSHPYLFCHLIPGESLVAQLQDLLCGGAVCPRAAATQGDTRALKMLADRGPMNVQLGADLSQGPASHVQICCALQEQTSRARIR